MFKNRYQRGRPHRAAGFFTILLYDTLCRVYRPL